MQTRRQQFFLWNPSGLSEVLDSLVRVHSVKDCVAIGLDRFGSDWYLLLGEVFRVQTV